MNFPSKLIEDAVTEISRLPGIGKKTALRLALHLLKQSEAHTEALALALSRMRQEIKYCKICHNVADEEECSICKSHRRDGSIICVVEDMRDVLAIENTNQYQGKYHVLGGVISPIQGIGPEDLKIESLINRIEKASESEPVKEVILALSATMEGDTTAFYLAKRLKEKGVSVSTIARGIPVGGELEFTDEVTLGRSIMTRINYNTD
ncbi:MAG TPA: recombination protein RecR [Algoriphagus sp.]|uniref:recombination mediator RecR n=2 Tax=Algoriphagus TaxID=246875 RepID=UPI000C6BF535|nr:MULTISPECIES: recombination mediator RecR [unclassified Algoriphagus]MAL13104.1 recombination protein RecR [Algoriphagus sp.]MAN87309.1 recombination protein RecR [Algoriphagus sp.]QYH41043.1 recombination protein RecR [Algoriphagus sp. NBT04N3]HAD51479.1 recombination protein RecR [Algoriphagus sp.]HAH36310.1 recombination protein RecR [Algoriphagus sp.]